MPTQLQFATAADAAAALLGDLNPLLEQIGSPHGLTGLAGSSRADAARPITSTVELQAAIADYQDRLLKPIELPAIRQAFQHAAAGELRELIAYDQTLAREPALQNFAAASRLAGHRQLDRLRPLRDDRFIQRYLAAVENNTAHGWHTLAYGVTLAVYSLPLRQGLLGYARQTTRGFLTAAARSLALSRSETDALFGQLTDSFPSVIEPLLNGELRVQQ